MLHLREHFSPTKSQHSKCQPANFGIANCLNRLEVDNKVIKKN